MYEFGDRPLVTDFFQRTFIDNKSEGLRMAMEHSEEPIDALEMTPVIPGRAILLH